MFKQSHDEPLLKALLALFFLLACLIMAAFIGVALT